MKEIQVRLAEDGDTAGILEVYAPYIRDTDITFEYEVPTTEEFEKRVRDIGRDYPYLVCLVDGRIAGYAYAHRHMERAAYQWNAELSVYVDSRLIHCGIGKRLYQAVLDILKLQNVQTVYGIVTWPNDNSCRLHEAMGFERRVIFSKMGYKFGAWKDVAWFEKNLGPHSGEMEPFRSICTISPQRISEILDRCRDQIAGGWRE